MLRHNRKTNNNHIGDSCKIRKRTCSSSSSSASGMKSYRYKKAVLVNKRGGSNTPVPPTWRISTIKSPASFVSPKLQNNVRGRQQVPVSARKLAATLWEMNEMLPSSSRLKENSDERRTRGRGRGRVGGSVYSGSFLQHLSDPSHSPVTLGTARSGTGSNHRRTSRLLRPSNGYNGGFDSISKASFMEIEARSRVQTPPGSMVGVKTRLKDLSSGLITSKELLKVLSRIWGVEEYHSSAKPLVLALRSELERTHTQLDQIIQEEHSEHKEINNLMKHFAEEKAVWKAKMQERIEVSVKSISGDLEMERKLRRRTESLNKALARELAETKITLSKAIKELESETRAREIVEEVCDELSRGIGNDRAEVEEMKKEALMVREEMEKEREMLQLADVLREERVQMKLLEAKYQFEEKNAAVEKLRNELEAFLKTKNSKEDQHGRIKDDELEIEGGQACKDDNDPEEDSAESDLHSIELNMDNNNRSFMWTYATGTVQENPKRCSTDKDIKGRKSITEKTARGRKSLERCISDGIEWDMSNGNFPNWEDRYGQGRSSQIEKQAHGEDFGVGTKENKSIKGLRDHILSSARMASARGCVSPTRQWGQL